MKYLDDAMKVKDPKIQAKAKQLKTEAAKAKDPNAVMAVMKKMKAFQKDLTKVKDDTKSIEAAIQKDTSQPMKVQRSKK